MDAVLAGNSTTVDLNLGSSIKNATMDEIKKAMAATVANCFFHFNTNAIKLEELNSLCPFEFSNIAVKNDKAAKIEKISD